MTLNEYRDDAGGFLKIISAGKEQVPKILGWLDDKTATLKEAASSGDLPRACHQIYDALFLLFELAALFEFDLDAEWATGRERKQEKYVNNDGNMDGN